MAKPFLKWAGGKTQLLPEIALRLPDDFAQNITTYVEPFLGGGAVFFYLQSKFKFEKVYLSDINPELILCYTTIKNDVVLFITATPPLSFRRVNQAHFYFANIYNISCRWDNPSSTTRPNKAFIIKAIATPLSRYR